MSKNPHAVALGRLGGARSRVARMADAYKPMRRKVAQIAATASWSDAARAKRKANGRKRRIAVQQR